jgi:hypothetical protein
MRPRVVFMPGVMGSVLLQTDPVRRLELKTLWGRPPMLLWRARPATWHARLLGGNGLSIPGAVRTDVPPRESPDGVVDIPVVSRPYAEIIRKLRAGTDLLVCPYDWRLSTDLNAAVLDRAVAARWFPRGIPANLSADRKVSLVTHSMGGLVARSLIEARGGAGYVRRLITAGTPHQGAPTAFTHFRGVTSALPQPLMNLAGQLALIRFCTSAAQLLPEYDFVQLPGGRWEPRATTYTSRLSAHVPTGLSVLDQIHLLRSGFQPRPPYTRLNDYLAAHGVDYHCVGSTGRDTVVAFDARLNAAVLTTDGDGTVPVVSSLCPEGPVAVGGSCHVRASNVFKYTFPNVEHQKLFEYGGIQDLTLGLLGIGRPVVRTAEFETLPELAGAGW